MRSSTACINLSYGIAEKELAISVSTTHRRPSQDSLMSTCRASCADRLGRNPKLKRQEIGLEDRLEHDLHRSLRDPVTDRGDRQRPALTAARLGDKHPPRRQRAPCALPQVGSQLAE
jgi:hypothetical protein